MARKPVGIDQTERLRNKIVELNIKRLIWFLSDVAFFTLASYFAFELQ